VVLDYKIFNNVCYLLTIFLYIWKNDNDMTYTEDLNRMLRYSIEALQKENKDLKKSNLALSNKVEELEARAEVNQIVEQFN